MLREIPGAKEQKQRERMTSAQAYTAPLSSTLCALRLSLPTTHQYDRTGDDQRKRKQQPAKCRTEHNAQQHQHADTDENNAQLPVTLHV